VITQRAVLEKAEALTLVEIAAAPHLELEILSGMEYRQGIAEPLRELTVALYLPEMMGLGRPPFS